MDSNSKPKARELTLTEIARKYPTDKTGHHEFTPIYERYLERLRWEPISLLELGIGGYEYRDRGGGSLKMWRDYFLLGKIHGVDIYDKSVFNEERVITYMGSQVDVDFLMNLLANIGDPDVIVDDASHNNKKTILSFEILFRRLKKGGVYFIEDVHTSYWDSEEYQGNADISRSIPDTTMNYFKMLTDMLNSEHIPHLKEQPWWMKEIKGIHFYREMIVIEKL